MNIGKRKQREIAKKIRSAISSANFERADFTPVGTVPALPTTKHDVNAWIKAHVKLYIKSYVVQPLEEALELLPERDT